MLKNSFMNDVLYIDSHFSTPTFSSVRLSTTTLVFRLCISHYLPNPTSFICSYLVTFTNELNINHVILNTVFKRALYSTTKPIFIVLQYTSVSVECVRDWYASLVNSVQVLSCVKPCFYYHFVFRYPRTKTLWVENLGDKFFLFSLCCTFALFTFGLFLPFKCGYLLTLII